MKKPFEDELKIRLSELNKIQEQLAQLNSQKKEIRDQVSQWLKINNLHLYEIRDNYDINWKLELSETSRRSVDMDALIPILDNIGKKDMIKTTRSSKLTIRTLK